MGSGGCFLLGWEVERRGFVRCGCSGYGGDIVRGFGRGWFSRVAGEVFGGFGVGR